MRDNRSTSAAGAHGDDALGLEYAERLAQGCSRDLKSFEHHRLVRQCIARRHAGTKDVVCDLHRYFRPGATVMWPQGTAEPLTLTRRLVEQRHDLEDLRVFVASLLGDVVTRDNVDGMRLTAPGGLARAGQLTRGGSVEILPVRISSIGRFLGAGRLHIDVALVQVSGPDAFGRYSVGCTSDYVLA